MRITGQLELISFLQKHTAQQFFLRESVTRCQVHRFDELGHQWFLYNQKVSLVATIFPVQVSKRHVLAFLLSITQ